MRTDLQNASVQKVAKSYQSIHRSFQKKPVIMKKGYFTKSISSF